MAEGGSYEDATGDCSDYVFDLHCEFCHEEGLHVEAEGFCCNCEEYLCANCVRHHRRTRLSRHHEILGKEDMPKDSHPALDRAQEDVSTMCKNHRREPVRFYCPSHDLLGCSLCFVVDHKACYLIDIVDESKNIFGSREFKDYLKTLESMKDKVSNILKTSRDRIDKSSRCCSQVLESIRNFREEINASLDAIENSLKAKTEQLMKAAEEAPESVMRMCEDAQQTVDQLASEMDQLKSDNRTSQAYIRMNETRRILQKTKQQLDEALQNNRDDSFAFIPNENLKEFLLRPDAMGLLSEQGDQNLPVSDSSSDDTSLFSDDDTERNQDTTDAIIDLPCRPDKTVLFVHNIKIGTSVDLFESIITGILILSKYKLLVVDNNNSKVKLINRRSMKLVDEVEVASNPWDICKFRKDKVAVTVPNRKAIRVLKISGVVIRDRQIDVDGECHGISYSQNNFIVSFTNIPKLEIMSVYGEVFRRIQSSKDGQTLFSQPNYVSVSIDGMDIYVSDFALDRVTKLNKKGNVLGVYSDSSLMGPQKLCIDGRGDLLVCGYKSNNVHKISPDFKTDKVVLKNTDGLLGSVNALSVISNTLYLGSRFSDQIKEYRLL